MKKFQESQYGYSLIGMQSTNPGSIRTPSHLAIYQEGTFTRRLNPPPSSEGRGEGPVLLNSTVSTGEDGGRYTVTVQPSPQPTPKHSAVAHNGNKDKEAIYYPESTLTTADSKGWDVFRTLPPPADYFMRGFWVDVALQLLKIVSYGAVFILLLGGTVISKGTFLLMTSAVGWGGRNTSLCNNPRTIGAYTNNTVLIEHKHVVKWVWSLYITICLPEALCFIKCMHRLIFRNVKKPTIIQFLIVFFVESLHAIGVGMLVFKVLPELDAVTGAMLTNCLCFVPAVLTLLSRKAERIAVILVVLDIVSIAAQSSGFWAWPVFIPELSNDVWAVPASLFLISLAWWPNYVSADSVFPAIRKLAKIAAELSEKRSKTYVVISVWKCLIFFATLFAFISLRMDPNELLAEDPFGHKPIKVFVWRPPNGVEADPNGPLDPPLFEEPFFPTAAPDYDTTTRGPRIIDAMNIPSGTDFLRNKRDIFKQKDDFVVKIFYTTPYDALWVVLIQAIASYVCYQCVKFASKVMLQRFSFALPIALTVPLTVLILTGFCSRRAETDCFLTQSLPYELFWRCYSSSASFQDFFTLPRTWVWVVWFLSQLWVTWHLWFPRCERLAKTEKLFVLPWFSSAFTDQSLGLNRRKDDTVKIKTEDVELESEDPVPQGVYETIQAVGNRTKTIAASICSENSSKSGSTLTRDGPSPGDTITKIYACATMWHESPIEMMCMLKSIFRLDEDQSARRNAQKYLKIIDPDYYEFEAHIFFDDAFETNEYGEPVVNKFVKQLLGKIDQAASAVHQTQMRLKPPKKFSTPYGGKIQWTLPGKNKLAIHMKDKLKIRHRKRWSQVMYLYYLLGFRLMQKVEHEQRKELISENTFILTLDGDVDFTPSCVHLLVDLMKKNRKLGAACGRIHPRGSGLMLWYQKFEYAIGHWFQKATEHMIGCVLCSPGCFSLFRSCALMDDNVAKRYATKSENPKDYIQYDQGEDRWLCTLLLQRGYRVEYCAASDALTFAPEGFNEFFNQRRRWIPSTIANISDLLFDYRNVINVNESISIWYICYQFVMLLSSLLGPGTIFLMVVGAISISFDVDTSVSFLCVCFPVILFCVVCLSCKPDKQLLIAQIIGALFAMLMTAVIVGTALQIKKDGIYSPHAIFLFAVILSFFIAACLHPLEFTCIIPGILYFMAIPCMYMMLPIYSICNLNVVTWGTRENPPGENEDNPKSKRGRNLNILEAAQLEPSEVDGVYSFGCGNMCRFMCCLQPSVIGNSPQMAKLSTKVEEMDKKIDRIDRRIFNGVQHRPSMGGSEHGRVFDGRTSILQEEDEALDDHFDLRPQAHDTERQKMMTESWLNERGLRRAERDYLEQEEETFWREMIDKYLYPLRHDRLERDRIKAGLGELRNKVCFAFFMMNALFILIVFLLQLKKDCLHLEWPFGPRVNHSIIPCNSDATKEVWVVTRLQLEPIGLVFLIFFVSILILQFFAMLFHRFGTLSHILASTELFCSRRPVDKLSEDELVVQNAVEIAKELQAIRGVDEEDTPAPDHAPPPDETISRRRVVKNLEHSRRSMMKRRTETLDAAFKKRFFALSSEIKAVETPVLGNRARLTMRKGTLRALEHRRQTMFGGTLDKHENAYSSEAKYQERGPARRRLDRIFQQHKDVDESASAKADAKAESSEDENDLKSLKSKTDTLTKSQSTSGQGISKHPIKKLMPTTTSWSDSPQEQQSGLLQSHNSSTSSSPTNDNLQARF